MNITFKVQEDATYEVYNNDKLIGTMSKEHLFWRFRPKETIFSKDYNDAISTLLEDNPIASQRTLVKKLKAIAEFTKNHLQ